jgi:hypothetical protein
MKSSGLPNSILEVEAIPSLGFACNKKARIPLSRGNRHKNILNILFIVTLLLLEETI